MHAPVSRESLTLERILSKARALDVPDYRLERVAGLSPGFLSQAKSQRFEQRQSTLAALALALSRLQANRDVDETERTRMTDMVVRVLTALVCQMEGVDPLAIHAQEPGKRATRSPEWVQAAEIRQTVTGIANTALGIPQAQLAKVDGISRAGICDRLARHENRRDDPAFDSRMDRIEQAIRGGI